MGLWRDIFGPGQNEMWGNIASEIHADFTPSEWFKRGRIDLRRDNFIISLDTYTVNHGKHSTTYTRMRSPFRNKNQIQMNIYLENIFSSLGKFFGVQDIIIGDAYFDKDFIIQGNPEIFIKKFLGDKQIKFLIQSLPDVSFQIKKDNSWFFKKYPEGVEELHFQCHGIIKNEARLKALFELFVISIDKLEELDKGCEFLTNLNPK